MSIARHHAEWFSLVPSQHWRRAELEAIVVSDLLGPTGSEREELTVRDRYIVGVLPPSRSGEGRAVSGEQDSSRSTHQRVTL